MIRIPLRTITVLLILAVIALAAYEVHAQAPAYTFLRTPWCGDGLPETDDGPLHEMCGGVERKTELPRINLQEKMEHTQLAMLAGGAVDVLIDPGLDNAIVDQEPGLDGKWLYYSRCHNVWHPSRPKQTVPDRCDIERIHVDTRAVELLVPGGIMLGAREYQPGKIVYQWHGAVGGFEEIGSPRGGGRSYQLAIYDVNTGAGEIIGHHSIGSAMHPTPLVNGAIAYSSLENQGVRFGHLWGIWSLYPDGRRFMPLWSGFKVKRIGATTQIKHFTAQLGNRRIVAGFYYGGSANGFGTLVEFAPHEADIGRPVFGSHNRHENVPLLYTRGVYTQAAFSPFGLRSLTEFATSSDHPAAPGTGKVQHPGADVDNGLILSFAAAPAGNSPPYIRSGVYRLPADADGALIPAKSPSDLQVVIDTPQWSEWWGRALVPYAAIYGQAAPDLLPAHPVSPRATPGEPFGWLGSSSTCHDGVLASEQTVDEVRSYNDAWFAQGIDPPYDCSSVVGMRIFALLPQLKVSKPGQWQERYEQFAGYAPERTYILGEVPIEADGSWLARVPADIPVNYGPINEQGDLLVPGGTWKKVAPHEDRHDCGGCHAHDLMPLPFEGTLASKPGYAPLDTAMQTPMMEAVGLVTRAERYVTVEWVRDIAQHFVPPGDTTPAPNRPAWSAVVAQIRQFRGATVPDSLRSPLTQSAEFVALPEPAQRTVRRWIGMGAPRNAAMAADRPRQEDGNWYVDDYPPTIALATDGGKLFVGAWDLMDTTVAPVVTVNGAVQELTQLSPVRWVAEGFSGGLVHAVATDANDNTREIKRVVGATPAPPVDPPVDPPDCPVCPDCPEVPPPTACPVPEVPTVTLACPPDTVICQLVSP